MKTKNIVIIIVLIILIGIASWFLLGRKQTISPGGTTVAPGGGGAGAPISDVAGKDISDVPRYPGSVRIYYGSIPGEKNVTTVAYLATASIDIVSNFYETQLPENGWKSPIDEQTMKEMMQMSGLTYRYVGQILEKGEEQMVILIAETSDYPGYTEISITFGPK